MGILLTAFDRFTFFFFLPVLVHLFKYEVHINLMVFSFFSMF